jgi:hypothetical protein
MKLKKSRIVVNGFFSFKGRDKNLKMTREDEIGVETLKMRCWSDFRIFEDFRHFLTLFGDFCLRPRKIALF